MSIKQQISKQANMMLIDMDQDISEFQNSNNYYKPQQKQPIILHQDKYQRIQINSLQTFKSSVTQKQSSSPSKTRELTTKKKLSKLSLKAKGNLQNNFYNTQIESISDLNSIDQSQIQINRKKCNQIQIASSQDQKSDSPQKLRKKINKFRITQKISLLSPPQQLYKKCYSFMDNIYSELYEQKNNKKAMIKIQQFANNTLPVIQKSYMRYVFEIHLYKYAFTFHTCYEFYIKNSYGQMIRLLKSEKDSFTVSSSHLLYATNPNNSNEKEFAAKLKYNTVKSEYNLYDVDEKDQPEIQRKFLATGFYQKSIGDQRLIRFYTPKSQFIHNDFIKSQKNSNLASFYKENQNPVYRKIEMLKTVSINKQNEFKVRQQFELKHQGRKIMVINQEGIQKIYMGKKANQRYLILAAGGLTPLQIFTLAILNLDH